MPCAFVFLALLLGVPAPLVTYTLEEKAASTTPNGERVWAFAARVAVAGDKARVELSGAAFPRARGSLLLLDGRGGVLVDPKEKEGAPLDGALLEGIFSAPAGDEGGGAGVRLRDKTVAVTPDGAGAPFQGMPTARYRVLVNAYVNVTTPGRVATIHEMTKGVIETAEIPEAASALDGLGRLFQARGELKEALDDELSRVQGFPVRVTLESEREMSAEAIGATAPHDALERPMRTTVRAERTVRDLTRRALTPRDRALFAVPEDVRLRAPERLLSGGAPAR